MWMSDEIEAVTEGAKAVQESAKLGQAVIEAGSDLAKYVGRALGTVPEDLVGLSFGDRLRVKRIENVTRMFREAEARLDNRNVEHREEINTKLIGPLLEAMSEESDETLQDLWAQLLANAMDPNSGVSLQRVLIDTLRRFEPIDAVVLGYYATADNPGFRSPAQVADSMNWRPTECAVSIQRLENLRCLDDVSRDNVGRPGLTRSTRSTLSGPSWAALAWPSLRSSTRPSPSALVYTENQGLPYPAGKHNRATQVVAA